ncbi:hypothetical protein RIF29_25853 [Crotalaria pallida]|uniref:Uncharacterized protein n=1 Tax=Crotalaria pallida TaxID=3830 RepID=A0AAN9EMZ6_CROPI
MKDLEELIDFFVAVKDTVAECHAYILFTTYSGIQAELVLGTIARKENKKGNSGHDYLVAGEMFFLSLEHMMIEAY